VHLDASVRACITGIDEADQKRFPGAWIERRGNKWLRESARQSRLPVQCRSIQARRVLQPSGKHIYVAIVELAVEIYVAGGWTSRGSRHRRGRIRGDLAEDRKVPLIDYAVSIHVAERIEQMGIVRKAA
jgi:hypothetical protein